MNDLRTLGELLHPTEDGWSLLQELLAGAGREVAVDPPDPAAAEATLLELQVTTRSMLGTLAYQNRTEARGGWIDRGYAYASGLVLTFIAILVTEYTDRVLHHSSIFAHGSFPILYRLCACEGERGGHE